MEKNAPILFIFSGLPATGKSTLAQGLSKYIKGVYLRIDTIEQGIRDLCDFSVEAEGYRLSYLLAHDNLTLGNHVVADSCNPIAISRKEWQDVALRAETQFINIEIVCSDQKEHRYRTENRVASVNNLQLPTWTDIQNRHYETWESPVLRLDTAHRTPSESLQELLCEIHNNVMLD